MHEIDLMSIGSYTELPGGNIALPQVLILETIHYYHCKETIHCHHYNYPGLLQPARPHRATDPRGAGAQAEADQADPVEVQGGGGRQGGLRI